MGDSGGDIESMVCDKGATVVVAVAGTGPVLVVI